MQKNQKKVMQQQFGNGVKQKQMIGQRDRAMGRNEFIGTLGRFKDPKHTWELTRKSLGEKDAH